MKKLFLEGSGILGKQDGIDQRKKLDLDTHDYSDDMVTIVIDNDIEGLSAKFCLEFIKATSYRVYDDAVPKSYNRPNKLGDDFGRILIGPYQIEPEGEETVAYIQLRHVLMGAVCGLYSNWERERRTGHDSLSQALEEYPELD